MGTEFESLNKVPTFAKLQGGNQILKKLNVKKKQNFKKIDLNIKPLKRIGLFKLRNDRKVDKRIDLTICKF